MRAAIRGRARAVDGALVVDAELLDVRPGRPWADARELPAAAPRPDDAAELPSLASATDAFQRQLVRRAVARCEGNWSAAARALGVDRSNLHRTARRLGLKQ
jgi:anaerobic nitric oxide reductase transcription regulator